MHTYMISMLVVIKFAGFIGFIDLQHLSIFSMAMALASNLHRHTDGTS